MMTLRFSPKLHEIERIWTPRGMNTWIHPPSPLRSATDLWTFYYRKLSEGNVFTGVCHSFCPWGCLPSHNAMGKQTAPGMHALTRRQTPLGMHPHRHAPLSENRPPPTRYSQPTGGTHPTGMHTCFLWKYFEWCNMTLTLLQSGTLL